jgi:DNA-binding NtrC family response regulator
MLQPRAASPVPLPTIGGRFRPQWPTVVIVASETSLRRRYSGQLRSEGYTVHAADGAASAMVILRDLDPSLTVIDLPPLERMRLIDALMRIDPQAPIYVVNDDSAQDLRTAVASLRRRDEELPPAV